MMQGMEGMDPMLMQMMLRQGGGQAMQPQGGAPSMGQGGMSGMPQMLQPQPSAPVPVANLGLGAQQPPPQQFGTGMPQFGMQSSPIQQQFAAQQQMTQTPQSGFGNWWDKHHGNVAQGLFAASNMF